MAPDDPLRGLGYAGPVTTLAFTRLGDAEPSRESAPIAEEVPVALVYNGRSHVVVMATPDELEDLAVGFSLTEGIVARAEDVRRVDVVKASHGIEVQVEIPVADAERLGQARGLVSRTGCGLCGVEAIADALRSPTVVGHALSVRSGVLWGAAGQLDRAQRFNRETHAVHAAGWFSPAGALVAAREDVGRHNALDKLLGALARQGSDARDGFVVVTSRASYEMIQKAAVRGVELIAAISRPTSLAVRFADASGMTLVGLLRGSTANVYTNPERIVPT